MFDITELLGSSNELDSICPDFEFDTSNVEENLQWEIEENSKEISPPDSFIDETLTDAVELIVASFQ